MFRPEDPTFVRADDGTWTRRQAVQRMAAAVGALCANTSCAAASPHVSVPDLRRASDLDDTAAIIRALESGNVAYCPAGRGSARDGAYILGAVPLRSGAMIRGDGPVSVLRVAPGEGSAFVAVSATSDEPLRDIVLTDLRIEGRVAETGFHEHFNLVSLSGVSGVRIERVHFVGFAGDGICLCAEQEGPQREPRIIRDVTISDCLFDGVNNDNRNAISVTGGQRIVIDGCRFLRCTRPNMPGPIDFEPDPFPFYRLGGLRVTGCIFEACGGNVGQISIVIPAMVPPPRNVIISGNDFRHYHGTGGDVVVTINREPNSAMPPINCVIERNVGVGGYSAVQIFSGRGVTIRNNRWTGYAGRSFLGYADAAAGVMDVVLSADQFVRCGWREGVALAIYKADGVRIEGVHFSDTGNGGSGSAPLYFGTGRIRNLTLLDNDFRGNPAARGLVIVERGADYPPGTARLSGNRIPDGLSLPHL